MNKTKLAVIISITALVAAVGIYAIITSNPVPAPEPTPTAQATQPVSVDVTPTNPPSPEPAAVPTAANSDASFLAKFYSYTPTPAQLVDEYLPDYDNYNEESPMTFGAEKYEGRRITVDNDDKIAEIYLTAVDGGVWAVILTVPSGGQDSNLTELYTRLAEWTIPDSNS